MVETLEHLIQHAAEHPKASRVSLYKELLRSETFLLSLDAPLDEEESTRVLSGEETFSIWADKDPELGGVWVPMFPARDAVARFVARKGLRAPKGREYLWMGHAPGAAFRLLRGVRCFAGLRLYLDDDAQLGVPWSAVKALSEGRLPAEEPELYELPVAKLTLPAGARAAFGRVDAGPGEHHGRLLCLPELGRFRAEDIRKLVRLEYGEEGTVWMACRHFLQILRARGAASDAESARYVSDLLRSFVGFEMYGEAEALCDWLVREGNESYAWKCLAAIQLMIGRHEECAALCRGGAAKYPEEKAFSVHGARALAALGRSEEALRVVAAGLAKFPGDASLTELAQELRNRREA